MIYIAITLYILGLVMALAWAEHSTEYQKWLVWTGLIFWPIFSTGIIIGVIYGLIRDMRIVAHYRNFIYVYWGYKTNRTWLDGSEEGKINWATNYAAMFPFVRKRFIKLVKEGKI